MSMRDGMMRSYHFTVREASGVMSLSAEVKAYSRQEAADRLGGHLPEVTDVFGYEPDELVVAVEIDFTPYSITVDQIDGEQILPEDTLIAFLNECLAERERALEVYWVKMPTSPLNGTKDKLIDGRYPAVVSSQRIAVDGAGEIMDGIEIEVTVAEGALVLDAEDLLRQIGDQA